MAKFGVGQPIRRKEDRRLLTGHGRYTDDLALPGEAQAYVLRAPHAHAEIVRIDTAAATAAPGVLAVLTGADVAADGLGNLDCPVVMENRDGSPIHKPPRPALAQGRVRHVGEPVAFVVAESLAQARDAAELVEVDYRALPAVTDAAAALSSEAPRIWPDAPENLCFDWETGDREATEAAFAKAHHVTRLRLVNNRVAAAPLEPRCALGDYDAESGRLTLYTPSQGVHAIRRYLAGIFDLAEERIRVVSGDVGGGFGLKLFLFPEHVLAPWAARRLGRPVRWTGDRGEAFLADVHGRDHVAEARLALDAEGRILGIQVEDVANLGAYLSTYAPFVASSAGVAMYAGVYGVPAVHVHIRGAYTNTCPVDAYRGAGRPEANYVVERLVDRAARELGLAPAELRRRNYVRAEAMPYRTALDVVYDSGDFARVQEDAMQAADWSGFAARREAAAARGALRGIGMAYYIEKCGGEPDEQAELRLAADGTATLLIGTQSNGQGHETAYAQLVAEKLGLALDDVQVVQGDTDRISYGTGTGGSRSLAVGGSAVYGAADRVIEKGLRIAAHLMEAAAADVRFEDGRFVIAGTDRAVSLKEVAAVAEDPARLPEGEAPGLDGVLKYLPKASTFPNGCHVCELEIDPQTGRVRVERFTVVDDFGVVINPLLVAGQVHGGVAQGLGQALLEGCVYDAQSGQLLTGSFMDYCLPRADDLPGFDLGHTVIPCAANPLGIKGCGEAGAVGAPPAVINAVIDALAPLGVLDIDMPATPERIWRAIRQAEAAGARRVVA